MTKQQVLDVFQQLGRKDNDDGGGEDAAVIEFDAFIEWFRDVLPECRRKQFLTLAKAMLDGVFQIRFTRRRRETFTNRLFVTPADFTVLQESNRFLRMTDNLSQFLHMGYQVTGPGNIRFIIENLIRLIDDQPLIKQLLEAGADHIECWMLMNLIIVHFDGQEFSDLYNAGQVTSMPTSYMARLSHRIHHGQCVLLNAGFISASSSSSNLYHVLSLRPRTMALIANPLSVT